jgi:hypothetical protein
VYQLNQESIYLTWHKNIHANCISFEYFPTNNLFMAIGTIIVLILILLHLIIGFGFIVKLMLPGKKHEKKDNEN